MSNGTIIGIIIVVVIIIRVIEEAGWGKARENASIIWFLIKVAFYGGVILAVILAFKYGLG